MTRRGAAAWIFAVALAAATTAAQAADLAISSEETTLSFEFDSTLHRVHGTARLREGSVRFEPAGGPASGRIVIDATSLDTDNSLRDAQMHGKVLESERFPDIEFVPTSLRVEERSADRARVRLVGTIRIHGGEWPLEIPADVSVDGDRIRVEGHFVVPYVEWGMRDMSNFLLSVDPEVVVHFQTLAPIPPDLAVAVVGGAQ